jgi:hypothetical protein
MPRPYAPPFPFFVALRYNQISGRDRKTAQWLKDRKGRTLNNDDITHYQRVVVALKETLRAMKEIDAAITKWPIE